MRREAFEENLDLQPQTERIGNQNKTMRKAKPKKHVILPDPVYGDVKVTKFVNNLMYSGKKSIAYSIFYNALELVANKMKNEELPSLEIWKKALENITPNVEVKSRRIGGARSWTPTTGKVAPSSARKTCCAWLRLTVRSHISDFSFLG